LDIGVNLIQIMYNGNCQCPMWEDSRCIPSFKFVFSTVEHFTSEITSKEQKSQWNKNISQK